MTTAAAGFSRPWAPRGPSFAYRTTPQPPPPTASPGTIRRGRDVQHIVSDPTFREFHGAWDHKIRKTVEDLRQGEHADDIVQEVYEFMCQREITGPGPNGTRIPLTKLEMKEWKKLSPLARVAKGWMPGKTGLERYDPAKGSFSCYCYRLIFLKILNYRAKLGRCRLTLMPMADSIDYADAHRQRSHRPGERAEFYLQLEQIAAAFDDSAADGFFDKTGRLVTRDSRTILALIIEGRTREEMAVALSGPKAKCTVVDVDRMIDSLRDSSELRELLTHVADADA